MTISRDKSRPNLGTMSHETLITLKVGPEAKRFVIHKDILSKQSPYFQAALVEGRWKEGQGNVVDLDETDPEIFEQILVEWLYTGKFNEDLDDETYIHGYVFADRYDFPGLRHGIIESLHRYYGKEKDSVPLYKDIILAFENLPATCKLCEFLVDLYGFRWAPADDNSSSEELAHREQLPVPFLLMFMVRLGDRKKVGAGHEHDLDHYSEQTAEAQSQAPE